MLKNKRLLVIIVVAAVILIGAVIGFLFIKKSGNREITFINKKEGENNKIAFLFNDHNETYAITIDEKCTIDNERNFFEENKSKTKFEVNFTGSDRIYITSEGIEITAEREDLVYNDESKIIKNDNRWLLLRDDNVTGNEVKYIMGYCVDENFKISDKEDYLLDSFINFSTMYDIKEERAINEYEQIKSVVNVYKASKNEEGILIFNDFEGNDVDLSQYQFIRDIINKSLFCYDIYIKNSAGIKESIDTIEVWYQVPEDENETQYEISVCTQEDVDENKKYAAYDLEYKFEHNNREYEVMTTELGGSLNFYTKIEDDKYLYVFMKGNDINNQSIKENVEIFVERMKGQLL